MKPSVLGALIVAMSIAPGAWSEDWQPISKNQDGLTHKIFRYKVLDFDDVAISSLGFTPEECRLIEPRNGKWVTSTQSRRLNNCLFDALDEAFDNQEYQGFVKAKIHLQGTGSADPERIATIRWKTIQVTDHDTNFWDGLFAVTDAPLFIGLQDYNLIQRFFQAWMSNDVFIDFDKPAHVADFQMDSWAQYMITGDPATTEIKSLELHTAEMELSKDNPFRMEGLLVGYDPDHKKVLALKLKLSWFIGHTKKWDLEVSSVGRKAFQ